MRLRKPPVARAFTLLELLVVLAIIAAIMGVAWPIFKVLKETVRVSGGTQRLKAGLQQLHITAQSYASLASRANTLPVIPGSKFGGTAMIVAWDAKHGTDTLFYALHNQSARDASGTLLAGLSPARSGYSLLTDYETVSLGQARVLGLRRRDGTPSGLELVPDLADPTLAAQSFAICASPRSVIIPPDDRICVNLQDPPPMQPVPPGPWNAWDTTPYGGTSGSGEMFPTALPIMVVYLDSKAGPLKDANGRIPASLDPNELVRVTGGQVLFLPLQGGVSSIEY